MDYGKGNALKKMAVFGSLSGEGSKLRERCDTSFLPHRSSRVLRGNGVLGVKLFFICLSLPDVQTINTQ